MEVHIKWELIGGKSLDICTLFEFVYCCCTLHTQIHATLYVLLLYNTTHTQIHATLYVLLLLLTVPKYTMSTICTNIPYLVVFWTAPCRVGQLQLPLGTWQDCT